MRSDFSINEGPCRGFHEHYNIDINMYYNININIVKGETGRSPTAPL